ncbi:MAG: nucleotide sugar dehydrogenase, partial [Chlamydiia bacterium]|nr:nucleotide sugar dehydrogenase [Chlamydiia bacterium]
PFYLTWKAREYGISTRFIELAGEINRSMPRWVLNKIQDCLNDSSKSLRGARILVFGLAYKPDISDMRESPSLELMTLLEEKGAVVEYHDPFIPEIGPTREYSELVGRRSAPPSRRYDCFVLATNHSCFSADEILSFGVPVVDTRHFFPTHDLVYRA